MEHFLLVILWLYVDIILILFFNFSVTDEYCKIHNAYKLVRRFKFNEQVY